MKKKQPHQVRILNNNKGWTTMEFLISFPLLVSALMLILYFGVLMQTQLALTFAANAAVRQLAKTRECGQADSVFGKNFNKPIAKRNCSADENVSIYNVEYNFHDIPLFLISLPSTTLKATASTVTEKIN